MTDCDNQAAQHQTDDFRSDVLAINMDGEDYYAHFNAECGRAVDLITGEDHDFGGGSKLPPYTARFWKCER